MRPARQHLDTDQAAGFDVDQRLEMRDDFVCCDSQAEIVFEQCEGARLRGPLRARIRGHDRDRPLWHDRD